MVRHPFRCVARPLRRARGGVLVAVLSLVAELGGAGVPVSAAAPVTAQVTAQAVVGLEGGGWGHGYGLSQWGAYGYAVDLGWTATAILGHYYGGTSAGVVPTDTVVTVRLQGLDDAQTAVVSASGGLVVDGLAGGPWKSVLAREVSPVGTPPAYAVWARADAEVCPAATGDPVVNGWTLVASSVPTAVEVRTQTDPYAAGTSYSQLPAVCEPGGTVRSYRGSIRAVNDANGRARTVNVVRLEQYLRPVIATEMSPSWAYAGPNPDATQLDRGFEALKAQAVAARGYTMASNHSTYARICDRTCQAYPGAATRTAVGASYTAREFVATDAAVTATAGGVRRVSTNLAVIANTMFAASNGGYTRPSPDPNMPFPAVVDDGDDTSLNPNYRWTASLDGAAIATRYGFASFTSLTITSTSGPVGDVFGGWVTGVRIDGIRSDGTAGYATMSGDTFRTHWSLKSNRFRILDAPPPPPDPCGTQVAPPVTDSLGAAPASLFQPLPLSRLVDTRTGVGAPLAPLVGGCTLVIDPGLADTSTSVVLNVAALAPSASGPVTVYPCGTTRPPVSNVQAVANRNVAALAVSRLGADGTVCLYSRVTTNLIVDVYGEYTPVAGSKYQPITTLRLYDSRAGAKVAGGTTLRVKAVRTGGAPSGAIAAAFTLHANDPDANGAVTVYPCTATRPAVSSLNATAGVSITNHVQVALSGTGEVCIYVAKTMHITLDMSGWFGSGGTASYYAVTPYRAVDSRVAKGISGALTAGSNKAVTLAPSSSIPAAATVRALVASVLSTQATATGFITVHPCLATVPSVSMVRYVAGVNAATLVVSPDDSSGRWCLYSNQYTHVIVDVSGYFA
ncbi:MAG: SpoIID/LytB domain-containing protein [Ilumatobacteraceae bacterium]